VDAAARSPVVAPLAGQEILVDQVPPQGRDVAVKPLEDEVHLALRVMDADLELKRKPLQNHHPLRATDRYLREPAGAEVLAQDRLLLLVRAERDARFPRR